MPSFVPTPRVQTLPYHITSNIIKSPTKSANTSTLAHKHEPKTNRNHSEEAEAISGATEQVATSTVVKNNNRQLRLIGWTKYIPIPTMGAIHRAINDFFVATVVPECFIVLWLTGL